MLFTFRQSLLSGIDVIDKHVLQHQVENIQGFVHLYVFSTSLHKIDCFHLVAVYKIEPKQKDLHTPQFTILHMYPIFGICIDRVQRQ